MPNDTPVTPEVDGHEATILARIAKGIGDPGSFTPRGDDYRESLLAWEARGVVLALAKAGYVVLPKAAIERHDADREAGTCSAPIEFYVEATNVE